MLKGFKYRIYPTITQSVLINKHIGACRFIYNLALETKKCAYAGNKINLSCFDLHKQLADLKKELVWLKEVNSQSLQQSITNMDTAFTNFFKGSANFPNFKNRNKTQSFKIPQNIIINKEKLFIPKFREGIKTVIHRPIKGIIKQATIVKTPSNKYFVSILCETGIDANKKFEIKTETTIGIDLGIKTLIVTSNGNLFENPKYLREAQSSLKYLQKRFSKNKGKRTKQKLAILHEKVANKRKDFLHKSSTKLIRENQSIAIEDLNIKGMVQNHKLAKSINDASWGMFIDMIKYKSEWYGVNILKIGRFDPSSKTCNYCGNVNKSLLLKDREWICNNCGTFLDRDINAAINIKNFALKNHLSAGHRLKNRNELPTLVGVLTCEEPINKK